jgi:NADPH:quinone reductase-like Zn-dependent oxidoreductase
MKAARRDRYGPPEVVEIREMDIPVPRDDQLLVKVAAASVNRADLDGLLPRWQFTRLFYGLRAPRTHSLGLDMAGTVESIGPAVTRFKVGDRVFADLFNFGQAAFAEYACAPERAFASVPAEMPLEVAATLPHSAVLALQGLRRADGRTAGKGDKVLIVGASGNVGPFAVQIAKERGAEVTGVCRTEKMEFVRSLGADNVVDYTTTDETRTGERYDWIMDVDAHHSFLRWRPALRPNGVYVGMGGPATWILQALVVAPVISLSGDRKLGLLLNWKPFKTEDVEELKSLVAAGKLMPIIDRRFTLDEVVEALRYVNDGRARGKVVITFEGSQ